MLHFGRINDEPTQAANLTASTQEALRLYRPGRYTLYSASELRYVRGPDAAGSDGSVVLPTEYDVIPAGAGIEVTITPQDIAKAERRRGEHFVDLFVWDLVGDTVRVTGS